MQSLPKPSPPHLLNASFGITLIVGLALRLYRLDFQSVWWDESYSIDLASRSLVEMTLATAGDIHPPLHYYLLSFWLPATGTTEWTVRFQAVIFGLLLIPIVYQIGKRLFGPWAGLAAAALIAIAPFHVAYSQEARMYTLETLLAAVAVWLMIRLLQRAAGGAPLLAAAAGYAAAAAFALYADYFPIFVLLAQNAFVIAWCGWWWRKNRPSDGARTSGLPALDRPQSLRLLRVWLAANAGAALLYLPWAVVAFLQVTGYGVGRISTPPLDQMALDVWAAYFMGQSAIPADVVGWLIAGSMALLAAAALLARSAPRPALLLLTLVVGPLIVFFAALLFRPFFNERYLLVATPVVALIIGAGMVAGLRRWRGASIAVAAPIVIMSFLSLNNHYFDPLFSKDDARSLMSYLEATTGPDDIVLVQTRHPFLYYYDLATPMHHLDARPDRTPAELAEVTDGKCRALWVTWEHSDTDPWGMVPFLLSRAGVQVEERPFTGYRVATYELPPDPRFDLGDLSPVGANFGDRIELEAARVEGPSGGGETPSNGDLWVTLQWRALSAPDREYKYFARLRDEKGRFITQHDRLLWNDQRFRTDLWTPGDTPLSFAPLSVPAGLAPATYQIEIGVYEERLEGNTVANVPLGVIAGSAPIILGEVRVLAPERPASLAEIEGITVDVAAAGLELAMYNIGLPEHDGVIEAQQGAALPVELIWRALEASPSGGGELILVDSAGKKVARVVTRPGGDDYSLSAWPKDEVIREFIDLRIPGELPPGDYALLVVLTEDISARLATIRIDEVVRSFQVPVIRNPDGRRFDDGIEFLGYDLSGDPSSENGRPDRPPAPGDAIELTLYWRATGTPLLDYTVFTQLLDADLRILGQKDNPPNQGASPTGRWVAGQVITDRYRIRIASDAKPGDYRLIVGMYDPATGARLRTEAGADFIELRRVRVGVR